MRKAEYATRRAVGIIWPPRNTKSNMLTLSKESEIDIMKRIIDYRL
jgi:hypothetical protein